jgi:5-methylcytosine-specific restriction endonuclease McrA
MIKICSLEKEGEGYKVVIELEKYYEVAHIGPENRKVVHYKLPKKDFKDYDHLVGVLGKFDPYLSMLPEPIVEASVNYIDLRELEKELKSKMIIYEDGKEVGRWTLRKIETDDKKLKKLLTSDFATKSGGTHYPSGIDYTEEVVYKAGTKEHFEALSIELWRFGYTIRKAKTDLCCAGFRRKFMRDKWAPDNSDQFSVYLKELRHNREEQKAEMKLSKRMRKSLSSEDREIVLQKTEGKCHICGGLIEGYWEADHVLAHSGGGEHSVDNYLPAHRTCNNYRWDYLPEEFIEILRLGVWLRTQIEKKTKVGKLAGDSFAKYEKWRLARRASKRR